MAAIQVLDQNTINQIAAGEVIERPASVVKELLENAIDSRATAVTVEIQGGGLQVIRVTDNGCGIPAGEIPLAFTRHATSKIRTADDLVSVASLGFRGEALASIASVARVELITRTSDSICGARYRIEGGEEKGLEEVGAPEGTTFLVRELFYNTPVRRKFLKSPATEGAHVADLVEKIALSHPEVSIRFINNGQSRLHTSGNRNLRDIIYSVFGREITGNLIEIEGGAAPVRLAGFIGKPLIARGNRNFEHYFINGRYIRSSLINKAIEEAYKPYMMQHKYPFTMLQFTIDSSLIDVNVHPAKMEIRFREADQIFRTVFHTLSMALSGRELIPAAEAPEPEILKRGEMPAVPPSLKPVRFREERPEPFETRRLKALPQQTDPGQRQLTQSRIQPERDQVQSEQSQVQAEQGQLQPGRGQLQPERDQLQAEQSQVQPERGQVQPEQSQTHPEQAEGKAESLPIMAENGPGYKAESLLPPASEPAEGKAVPRQMDLFEDRLLTREARKEHILIGQLFDTYWLVQYRSNLYIIDQHAAHEKVLYERTMVSLKNREYTSQMVDPPIILTLNDTEQLILKRFSSQFSEIGFEIEPFGGREFAVRAVPANLFSIARRELLMEMLDSLAESGESKTPDLIRERVASMSCKAAVKGNHALSAAEAEALIDELLELDNPYACPHGRPTIISMSKHELEKKFKRIV